MQIVHPLKSLLLLIWFLAFNVANAGLSIKINPFTYGGEYEEGNNIPLIYLNARYLHVPSGQSGIAYFIQRDHYDTAAKSNLFDNRYNAFADNPIGNQDPSGRQASSLMGLFQLVVALAMQSAKRFTIQNTRVSRLLTCGSISNTASAMAIIASQRVGHVPRVQRSDDILLYEKVLTVAASMAIFMIDTSMLQLTGFSRYSVVPLLGDMGLQAAMGLGAINRRSKKFNNSLASITTIASFSAIYAGRQL